MIGRIIYPIKVLSAKYHLRFRCPNCPEERMKKRDIENKGRCYWLHNWKKGNYGIRSYQAYKIMQFLKGK